MLDALFRVVSKYFRRSRSCPVKATRIALYRICTVSVDALIQALLNFFNVPRNLCKADSVVRRVLSASALVAAARLQYAKGYEDSSESVPSWGSWSSTGNVQSQISPSLRKKPAASTGKSGRMAWQCIIAANPALRQG